MYKTFLTVVGVALFARIDRAKNSVTLASCICGITAFVISEILIHWLGSGFIMYFISAAVVCFLAEIGARLIRVPVTVILLPAIIPLVPGSLLYSTMKALMSGNVLWYSDYGKEAIGATAGIGVAIVFVSATARVIYGVCSRIIVKYKKLLRRNA